MRATEEVTKLLNKLKVWQRRRIEQGHDNQDLDEAIAMLTEYRTLLQPTATSNKEILTDDVVPKYCEVGEMSQFVQHQLTTIVVVGKTQWGSTAKMCKTCARRYSKGKMKLYVRKLTGEWHMTFHGEMRRKVHND